jgi:hypothetical protein
METHQVGLCWKVPLLVSVLVKGKRNAIRTFCTAALVLSLPFVTGCSYFSKTAQDKAACDKFSDIITSYTGSGSTSEADVLYQLGYSGSLTTFADRVDSEVKPLASMDFASTIDKLVKYLRKATSNSIFDVGASYTYGVSTLTEVSAHCVLVSKEN